MHGADNDLNVLLDKRSGNLLVVFVLSAEPAVTDFLPRSLPPILNRMMPQMRALQFVLTIIPVQVSQHRYVPPPSKT
jgi:hypothetical protein